MGEPVRIVDLAEEMIRLSGFEPNVDIEIRFTGTRPGEKLFEELTFDGEDMLPTYHEKIKIFSGPRKGATAMDQWISNLKEVVAYGDNVSVLKHLRDLVPEYQPIGAWRDVLEPRQMAAVAVT
jgi:FlaA1/EpsC-like NDP-sugar epimerase